MVIEDILFAPSFQRPSPTKYSIYCILKSSRKDKSGTIVFSKAQRSKMAHLLCLQSLSLAKYSIYCDFEGSAEQSIECIYVSNGLTKHI